MLWIFLEILVDHVQSAREHIIQYDGDLVSHHWLQQ